MFYKRTLFWSDPIHKLQLEIKIHFLPILIKLLVDTLAFRFFLKLETCRHFQFKLESLTLMFGLSSKKLKKQVDGANFGVKNECCQSKICPNCLYI